MEDNNKESKTSFWKNINSVLKKYRILVVILWAIKSIILFIISPLFIYIIIGILIFAIIIAFFFIIIILFSIDFNNIPYYYTREPVSYNLPSISYKLEDYWTGASALSNFVNNKSELKLDLISNIYFYKENQDFLSKINFPIQSLSKVKLELIEGNLYSETKWVDFKYSFIDKKDINGILSKSELKEYNENFKSLENKIKIWTWITLPKVLVNFQTQESSYFSENEKKHFKLEVPLYWYWLKYKYQDDSTKPWYWKYKVSLYLDINWEEYSWISNWLDVKNLIRNYFFVNYLSGTIKNEISLFLTQNFQESDVYNKQLQNKYKEYFKIEWNPQSLSSCINSMNYLNLVSNYFLSTSCKPEEIWLAQYIVSWKITHFSWFENAKYENPLLSKYINANKSWIGLSSAFNDLESIKYTNSYEEYKDSNSSDSKEKIKKELSKVTNPYIYFDSDDVDRTKNQGWEFTLPPWMMLYSLYLMQKESADKIWGYDYLLPIINKEYSTIRNTIIWIIWKNIDENNNVLANNTDGLFSQKYWDYYRKYLDWYFSSSSMLDRWENWIYKNLDKYWNNFVKLNYETNFSSYKIKDYYYINENDAVVSMKSSFDDKFLNVYPDEANSDDLKLDSIKNWIFSCSNFSIPEFYKCLSKSASKSKDVFYIDRNSVYSFAKFQESITQNEWRIDSNTLDKFFNKFRADDVNPTTNLDKEIYQTPQQEKIYLKQLDAQTYFYFFDSAGNSLWNSSSFVNFLENLNSLFQQSIWIKLESSEVQTIFNSYNFLIWNKIINRDFTTITSWEDRNALEFLIYPYNNITYNFDDFIKENKLNSLSNASIANQKKSDMEIENKFKPFKDFFQNSLKTIAIQEMKDWNSILTSGTIDLCKEKNSTANNFCITLLSNLKESVNSESNVTSYNKYTFLQSYICTLKEDDDLFKDKQIDTDWNITNKESSDISAIQKLENVKSSTESSSWTLTSEESKELPVYKDYRTWLYWKNSIGYNIFKSCGK